MIVVVVCSVVDRIVGWLFVRLFDWCVYVVLCRLLVGVWCVCLFGRCVCSVGRARRLVGWLVVCLHDRCDCVCCYAFACLLCVCLCMGLLCVCCVVGWLVGCEFGEYDCVLHYWFVRVCVCSFDCFVVGMFLARLLVWSFVCVRLLRVVALRFVGWFARWAFACLVGYLLVGVLVRSIVCLCCVCGCCCFYVFVLLFAGWSVCRLLVCVTG